MKTDNLILGSELNREAQAMALASFVHRFTGEHKPEWAHGHWKDGKTYPVQFKDDAEWLAHTKFHVRKDGRLDGRYDHCWSNPTWPHNPELRKTT